MEKVKITLDSGGLIEKNLLTAFVDNDKTYVILDNETNGSMGLPIILVTTLNGNRFEKIPDKSQEWEEAKNHLRSIINSEQINYVTIPLEVQASDLYYTQLTLPVASFDALKNNYKVDTVDLNSGENAVADSTDNIEIDSNLNVDSADEKVDEITADDKANAEISNTSQTTQSEGIAKKVVDKTTQKIDIAQEKETFMKACENMFDALVAKFDK